MPSLLRSIRGVECLVLQLPVTSHNDAAGAKLWSAGFTPSPSGLLPIFSLVCFAQRALPSKAFSRSEPAQPVPSAPSVTPLQSNWIKVPQRDYDRGRKRWNFERLAPIVFNVNGSPGINLGDALRKTFTGLDGRDDPVLQEAAGAISCRLLVGHIVVFRETAGVNLIPSSPDIRPTAARARYVYRTD